MITLPGTTSATTTGTSTPGIPSTGVDPTLSVVFVVVTAAIAIAGIVALYVTRSA